MKAFKSLLIYEVLAIILLFVIYFEFSFLCSYADKSINYSPSISQQKQERPLIKSTVRLDKQTVKISEEIFFADMTKDVWLNIPSSLFAKTKITKITPENYNIEHLNDDAAMHLSFSSEVASVTIQYEVCLDNKREILSYQNNTVLLTQFSITPAQFITGNPVLTKQVEFGDPFVYQMYDYDITLIADSAYKAYAPGKVSEKVNGQQKTYLFKAKAIRDFPIALFVYPKETKCKIRDIEVTYIGMPDVNQKVIDMVDFIEQKTFLYPYKELFVILAPIGQRGMEFSQMIFISDAESKDRMLFDKILCHEIFHQWFYGLIGTDQINEPFMDEGLTNYLTKSYFNEKISNSYDKHIAEFGIEKFNSKENYNKMIYEDGASFFNKLHKDFGEKFDFLLKRVSVKYSGGILTKDNFFQELDLMKNGDD